MPACVIAGEVSVGRLAASAVALAPSEPSALARPKSRTFTRPSRVTLTLAGFRSRCTMPASCAVSSASAIWRAMRQCLVERHGAASDPFSQVLAVDQFHHDGARVAARLEAVDLRDAGG